MPSPTPALLAIALVAIPLKAEVDRRAQAEALVAEAVAVLRSSGLDKLVHEINHANGRLAKKDASSPQLIIYDLKGKTLAYAGDSRHIGMDHSKAMTAFFSHSRSIHKGWYPPRSEAGTTPTAIYFEKVGDILITATLHIH